MFIIKKAQLLAGDLYRNFKSRDKKFDFVDISQLTIFTDNVVPAVLRKVLYRGVSGNKNIYVVGYIGVVQ